MVVITKIQVDITTGADDPDNDTRIFLGFESKQVLAGTVPLTSGGGREFRLRTGNDANPFRPGAQTLIFGIDHNVKNDALNNPSTPYPLDTSFIENVYIRVSPGSKESWLINSATVQLFQGPPGPTTPIPGGGFPPGKYALPGPATIVLQEDAGEKVYLRPVV